MNNTITNDAVEKRLARLPAKVAAPFRQLLKTGQLSEDVIETILDAGEVAHDTNKLIGFAAGYLHLRAQGIPVHDVIAMAKDQGRRITLTWSPQRWKDEHERLSRAEALGRLAKESLHYDVSAYAEHLPTRFPGYLIRTSRRLGMEGLRQRHCVAAYHDRIKTGTCAIAAVFAGKRRWTVQLELTKDGGAPLRITQIKTCYNELPPAATRQEIHDILGIAVPKAHPAATNADDGDCVYMENLRRILPRLRQQGIETVTVSFEGSGDSGSIEHVDYHPQGNAAGITNEMVEHLSTQRYFDDGAWRSTLTPEVTTLGDVVEALTYDYLEETGVDWCNNDGGYGELNIDVTNGTVSLEVNVRYTESTTEFSAERDIETGDEI
jgi:hypothetical protein